MSKIEEMIESSGIFFEQQSDEQKVYDLVKEYAEYYAKRCLEIAETYLPYLPTEIHLPPHD